MDKIKIFLSYAREDQDIIANLYNDLKEKGLDPWMDKKDIHPGEDWERSIWRAIRKSDFFLICLSEKAIGKRGFLQREIKRALNIWEEKLEDDIYLIPVRLEKCDVPHILQNFQWVDIFSNNGFDKLIKAIEIGAERRELISEKSKAESKPFIVAKDLSEQKQGSISYNVSIAYPQIEGTNASWKNEINGILSGIANEKFQDFRKRSLESLNDEELGSMLSATAINELNIKYEVSVFDKNILSIVFSESWYGAGAAHHNYHAFTKNYQLNPTFPIKLRDIFQSEVDYLERLSNICLKDLKRQAEKDLAGNNPEENYTEDTVWKKGAAPKDKNFENFRITSDKLIIFFDPYQVGPFAWGSRQVEIPFRELQGYINLAGPLSRLVTLSGAA